jgi:5'-3' exoribonuclease 2
LIKANNCSDGVAPRAKMNQQRSRRFRSAQDKQEKEEQQEEFRKLLLASGNPKGDDSESEDEEIWDSNVITPGTPFMDILAQSLRYWCAYKLNTDPMWAKMKIIISDATVPGEGEHKIMEFVRSQRRSPEYDPNTRHVIYGLDADLIMLGIATHEPHFRILREDVFFQSAKPGACRICGQQGHMAASCTGKTKKKHGEYDEKSGPPPLKPFIWLKVNVLREYLAEELYVATQGFKFDLERALDDWVFLCFFVGNDFLPHLPSLAIREEGIDTLLAVWRDNLPIMGGYITKDGHVDLVRAQSILSGLAVQEDAIFKRRKQIDDKRNANQKRRKIEEDRRNARQNNDSPYGTPTNQQPRFGKQENHEDVQLFTPGQARTEVRKLTHEMMVNKKANFQASIAGKTEENKSAAAVLKEQLMAKKRAASEAVIADGDAGNEEPAAAQTPPSALGKRKADMLDEENGTPGRSTPISAVSTPGANSDEPPPDNVRLWEEGYADRYYENKFHNTDPAFRRQVANDYVEGVCWVLAYYLQGCPSWTWFYPHHYAPFAADFVDIQNVKIDFDEGKPFRPYEQLMGVLPAASRHAIPEKFHSLMTDDDSPIKHFYPEDFVVDLNGGKFKWQGVALLPWINADELLAAMATKYPLLTEEEHSRNQVGKDVLLFHSQHPMYEDLAMSWYSKKQGEAKMKLNAKKSEGLSGHVEKNEEYIPQSALVYPLANGGMPTLDMDQSMSVIFEMPSSKHVHKSMLLRGVIMPTPELDNGDIQKTRGLAAKAGRGYGGAPLNNNGGYRDGNNNGRGRGGRINYANPFAAHLNFPPGQAPPPPHLMAQQGFAPPPPPGWTPQGGNNNGSYNSGYNNNSYNNQGYQGQGNQGYGHDQNQYQGQGRRDEHSNGGGGYRGGRGGRGGGGGGGGGRGGGRGRGEYNGNRY